MTKPPSRPTNSNGPCKPGSIAPVTREAVRLMIDYYEARSAVMQAQLYRRRLRPSFLRDALLRHIILDFADGRSKLVSQYQAEMGRYASASAVRAEIELLAELGVVWLERAFGAQRTVTVLPTERLCAFYNTQMTALVRETVKVASSLEENGQP